MKAAGAMAVMVGLGACAAPDPFAVTSLPKGAQLDVRDMFAAHPGQTLCVDHQAADDSCASAITAEITGDRMISREIGLVQLPEEGAAQRVEIMTRAMLQGGQACAGAQDITTPGRDEISGVLLEITRDLVNQSGGTVCGSYYRSGERYVLSPVGSNGTPFALGDSYVKFIDGPAKLRVQ
jgi:hypothetical protein